MVKSRAEMRRKAFRHRYTDRLFQSQTVSGGDCLTRIYQRGRGNSRSILTIPLYDVAPPALQERGELRYSQAFIEQTNGFVLQFRHDVSRRNGKRRECLERISKALGYTHSLNSNCAENLGATSPACAGMYAFVIRTQEQLAAICEILTEYSKLIYKFHRKQGN